VKHPHAVAQQVQHMLQGLKVAELDVTGPAEEEGVAVVKKLLVHDPNSRVQGPIGSLYSKLDVARRPVDVHTQVITLEGLGFFIRGRKALPGHVEKFEKLDQLLSQEIREGIRRDMEVGLPETNHRVAKVGHERQEETLHEGGPLGDEYPRGEGGGDGRVLHPEKLGGPLADHLEDDV